MRAWANGSAGKVLATKAERPELKSQAPVTSVLAVEVPQLTLIVIKLTES